MAIEVACSGCQGHLLAETPGIVVACPHCGLHLSIPESFGQATGQGPAEQTAGPDGPESGVPAFDPDAQTVPQMQDQADLPGMPPSDESEPLSSPDTVSSSPEPSPDAYSDGSFPDQTALPAGTSPDFVETPSNENVAAEQEPASVLEPATQDETPPTSDAGFESPEQPVPEPDGSQQPDEAPAPELSQAQGSESIFSEDATVPTDAETPGGKPAPELSQTPGSESVFSDDAPVPTDAETPGGEPDEPTQPPAFGFEPSQAPPTDFVPPDPSAGEYPQADEASSMPTASEWAFQPNEAADLMPPQAAEAPAETTVPHDEAAATAEWGHQPTATADLPAESVPATTEAPAGSRGVSRWLFVVVLSYASAITIVCAVLLLKTVGAGANPHDLESLPDLKPPPETRKKHATLILVPEDAEMAPGHTLAFGERRRFGSLEVTALRVTRTALEFAHYTGDAAKTTEATEPVLKLWLRLKNVSDHQVFAPLDRELVLTRVSDKRDRSRFCANHFVCKRSAKGSREQKTLVYDLPMVSEWDLKDCVWSRNDDAVRELKPGDTVETYISTTEEGLEELQGQLVWRVHFRKGYNPESLRGVTTIIEVNFRSDQIQAG